MGHSEMNFSDIEKHSRHNGTTQLLEEYKEIFNFYDEKALGVINIEDLSSLLNKLGGNISIKDIQQLRKDASLSGRRELSTEEINFTEFVSLMTMMNTCNWVDDDEMHLVFRQFDVDEDGFISRKDLKKLLVSLGENVADDELQEMMREADKDGDGKVNYVEFIRVMTGTSAPTEKQSIEQNNMQKRKNSTELNKAKTNKKQVLKEVDNNPIKYSQTTPKSKIQDKNRKRALSCIIRIQEQVTRIKMVISVRRILNRGSWE